MKKLRSDALLTALSGLVLLWSAREVLASAPTCATNGYKTGTNYVITCTGWCDEPGAACPNPPWGSGYNVVLGTYKFCACPDEPESNCCHLVLKLTGAGDRIVPNGDCPNDLACPGAGQCRKTGSGTEQSPWVKVCDP